MPKFIDFNEFMPLRSISVINIQTNWFANIIVSTPNYKHEGTDEHSSVLISFCRFDSTVSIGCLHPIKSAILVLSKSPCIVKRLPIGSSTSENDIHPICSAGSTDTAGVINSWWRVILPCIDFSPLESVVNIINPHITHRFSPDIAPVDN